MDLNDAMDVLTSMVDGYGSGEESEAWGVVCDALDAARARVAELEAELRVCGAADGQYRCNIHRGHEGRHTAAINGHVLHAWDDNRDGIRTMAGRNRR